MGRFIFVPHVVRYLRIPLLPTQWFGLDTTKGSSLISICQCNLDPFTNDYGPASNLC